jgi:hypothetical protein
MSTSIDQAFVTMFASDVHVAYQRMGSKLRNTVRAKSQVNGDEIVFQKYGKGTAGTKSRHGNVPLMNVDHSTVTCPIEDHYAGEYVDKLDELKVNIDERTLAANAGAYALGRKTDEILVTVMDTSTNATVHGGTGLTKAKIETVFVDFGNNDVPEDGERFWPVSHKQWTNLMAITEFSSSDYVGPDQLPYAGGMVAKRWMGFMFFTFSGLPVSGGVRKTFAYHRSALGHGIGEEVTQDITWNGEKQAHLVVNRMSQGAVLVDATALYEVECQE